MKISLNDKPCILSSNEFIKIICIEDYNNYVKKYQIFDAIKININNLDYYDFEDSEGFKACRVADFFVTLAEFRELLIDDILEN